jgi:hypothetical protein
MAGKTHYGETRMSNSFLTLLAGLSRKQSSALPQRIRRGRFSSFEQSRRPELEMLEERRTPTGTISGHAFVDMTGNGLTTDDTAQAGVSIKVFADTAGTGKLNANDKLVASLSTDANGAYSFNLGAGTYFVAESTPKGFVRTTPTAASYYTVNLGDGQSVGAEDFANFQLVDKNAVTNVSFTIVSANGATKTVTNLRGQTQQGDTVTANFTIAANASATGVVVSFAAYDAPGASFDANTAAQQVMVETATGTFLPGQQGSLTIHVPDNFYQIDFIAGTPIDHLGPAGSNIFYSAQHRLISADNEGTQAEAPGSLAGFITDTTGAGIAGVTVTLTGTNDIGQTVTLTATTDMNGFYNFMNLRAGTYALAATTPTNDTAVSATAGSLGGTADSSNLDIASILLGNGINGTGYDFVLQPAPPSHGGGPA